MYNNLFIYIYIYIVIYILIYTYIICIHSRFYADSWYFIYWKNPPHPTSSHCKNHPLRCSLLASIVAGITRPRCMVHTSLAAKQLTRQFSCLDVSETGILDARLFTFGAYQWCICMFDVRKNMKLTGICWYMLVPILNAHGWHMKCATLASSGCDTILLSDFWSAKEINLPFPVVILSYLESFPKVTMQIHPTWPFCGFLDFDSWFSGMLLLISNVQCSRYQDVFFPRSLMWNHQWPAAPKCPRFFTSTGGYRTPEAIAMKIWALRRMRQKRNLLGMHS